MDAIPRLKPVPAATKRGTGYSMIAGADMHIAYKRPG